MRQRKRPKSDLEGAGSILSQILSSGPWATKLKQGQVFGEWKNLVGAEINKNARPKRLYAETLVVGVTNSVWINELQMLKPMLLEKISQSKSGEMIKDIRFELGLPNPSENT